MGNPADKVGDPTRSIRGKARYSKQFENPPVSNDAIIPLTVQIRQWKQHVQCTSGVVQLSPPIPRRIMYSGAGFRLRRGCNKKITGLPNEKNSIISGAAFLPIPGSQPINAAVILRRESGHLFLSIARNGRERPKIC